MELKPCPFCGETPTLSKHFKHEMWQMVHRCPVMGGITIDWENNSTTIAERWNTRALPDSGEVVADMFWPTDDYETCLDDPADYADQSSEEALVFEVACAKKLPNEFVAARYVEKEGWVVSYHDTEAEADKALEGPKP